MFPPPRMAFSHMGIYVRDMQRMVEFYTKVLGFTVTDRAIIRGANVVFLSRNPQEHHQIVLVPGRDAVQPSTINQISFQVISLPELRRISLELERQGFVLNPTNHGGSWSLYFADPEGSRIELFTRTSWYIPPISIPLDLGLTDQEIYDLTEKLVCATPGHMPRADWYAQTRQRMLEEGTLEQRQVE